MSLKALWHTRSFRFSVVLYLLFNSLFLALVLIKPGPFGVFVTLDDIGQALGWLLATGFCFIGMQKPWKRAPSPSAPTEARIIRWMPLLVASGIFCQFIGQLMYTYYDLHHWITFPSWADVAYLSTFPLLCLSAFFLCPRPPTRTTRWCIFLDSWILMVTLITFSWYVVLGPIILHGQETLLAKVVGSAYPIFGLIVLFSALQLVLRVSDPHVRWVVYFFVLGMFLIVLTDSIYDYQTLRGIYRNGWQDAGWPLGYMLLGLAIQTWNIVSHQQHRNTSNAQEVATDEACFLLRASSSRWYALLPYVLIPAIEVLTIFVWVKGATSLLAQGVYLGNITLIGLVVLRQVFVTRQLLLGSGKLCRLDEHIDPQHTARTNQNMTHLMTDFLMLANHELRTPLTGIKGNLQLAHHRLERLKRENKSQSEQVTERIAQTQMPLESATQCTLRQERMINAMIDHARIQAGVLTLSKARWDLCELVESVVMQQQPTFPQHQIRRAFLPREQVVPVIADEERIRHVITIYLTNALTYSSPGQPVTIQLTVGPVLACVAVHNEGAGIPKDEQEHLWDCFYRAKGMAVQNDLDLSLGLDLYLCRAFVEHHQGNVGVESAPGQGATFWFTLPRAS